MNPGKLDHLIVFQSKTIPETKDSYGNIQEDWDDGAFDSWAKFEPAASKEFPTAWKRYAKSTGRFVVRYDRRLMAANASDLYQIVETVDDLSSPAITATWDISPPYFITGEAYLAVEVSEVKG